MKKYNDVKLLEELLDDYNTEVVGQRACDADCPNVTYPVRRTVAYGGHYGCVWYKYDPGCGKKTTYTAKFTSRW